MIDFAPHIPGFIAAFSILIVAASSPGPAVAMLLGIATNQGRAPALVASAGIATGSILINVMTLLGVGLLLSHAAWAMTGLRLIGGAYLLWLAYRAFQKSLNPPAIQRSAVATKSSVKHFGAGFLLQVTNPKAIVFWLAIASVGATEGGGPVVVLLFVFGAFCISFACHGGWAIVLSSSPIRTAYSKSRRWIEAMLGAFFTFAAFNLGTAES